MPDPQAAPTGAPPANLLSLITTLLAGAGFKNVSKGVTDLAASGVNAQAMMGDPNLKMFMAGAGVKDAANSMDLIQPMMKMLNPPAPPPPPDPREMGAAMQMLSANLGPGMTGIRPPMGPSAVGMPGAPAMPPPSMMSMPPSGGSTGPGGY